MTKSFKNILVPINFSESSENAVKAGIAMCKRHKSALHLLFVKADLKLIYPPGKNPQLLEMILRESVALQDQLEAQAKRIESEYGISCFFHTAEGVFHKAVAATAEDFYCDLVILEKSKAGGILSVPGKNSVYKILKTASCPVLTIPRQGRTFEFRNILFPVRPVAAGLEKLDVALPIFKRNHSKVLLFSPVKKHSQDKDLAVARELINRGYYLLSVNQVDAEKELDFTDRLADEVVNKAIERESDLIIITATITNGLKSMFSKNYTERVIEFSPVPVLSVKPREAEGSAGTPLSTPVSRKVRTGSLF